MFAKHREKEAAKAYEQALGQWQAQRDDLVLWHGSSVMYSGGLPEVGVIPHRETG